MTSMNYTTEKQKEVNITWVHHFLEVHNWPCMVYHIPSFSNGLLFGCTWLHLQQEQGWPCTLQIRKTGLEGASLVDGKGGEGAHYLFWPAAGDKDWRCSVGADIGLMSIWNVQSSQRALHIPKWLMWTLWPALCSIETCPPARVHNLFLSYAQANETGCPLHVQRLEKAAAAHSLGIICRSSYAYPWQTEVFEIPPKWIPGAPLLQLQTSQVARLWYHLHGSACTTRSPWDPESNLVGPHRPQ